MRQLAGEAPPDRASDPLRLLSPPPRHYATLPSSSATVLWYLLRLEPYASLHVALQGGRFDRPDRQCGAVEAAWRGACENDGDCRELVPEWFALPAVFQNINQWAKQGRAVTRSFDLGPLQGARERLGEVKLPAWAGNAYECVLRLQDALESEFVGSHLHQWIDLVFGANQRGAGAERAGNVYPHLAYLTEAQAEELAQQRFDLYLQAAEIVQSFGQVPAQVALPAGIHSRSPRRRIAHGKRTGSPAG